MGLAQQQRTLELSSQAALLERMQLLASFGSNLIHVVGENGAGKSWIAQRYLEAWAEDKNQSLLLCFHKQSDPQHRHTMLTQLRPNISIDPDAPLVDSFYQLFEHESCNVVIVVDDAQFLSQALLSELWTLVQEAQGQPKWSINVVLFSLPNVLDRFLERLSYGQEQKPVELEIEVLSDEDADRLFEFSVMRFVDDQMERRVRIAYSKAKKIPGEIMALGEQKMEKRIIIRSIVASPINIAIVAVLLALAIGGGYWWLLGQPVLPESTPVTVQSSETGLQELQQSVSTDNMEQTAIPTLALDATEQTGELNSAAQIQSANQSDSTSAVQPRAATIEVARLDPNAADDSNALPPSVVSNGENVGVDDGRKRVVITSEVVDALMDGTATTPPVVEAAAVESGLMTRTAASTPISAAPQPEQSLTDNLTSAIPDAQGIPAVNPTPTPSTGEGRLMAMPDRSYTLQLAAFNTQADVDKFIGSNYLEDKANVYKTVRQDVTWFIVTYDNFATLQQARDAVETLPRPVQQLSPWAKSLRQVQREIELFK